jgi:hypothetical protein
LQTCDLLERYGSWEGPETGVEYLAYLNNEYGSSGDESGDESDSDDSNYFPAAVLAHLARTWVSNTIDQEPNG